MCFVVQNPSPETSSENDPNFGGKGVVTDSYVSLEPQPAKTMLSYRLHSFEIKVLPVTNPYNRETKGKQKGDKRETKGRQWRQQGANRETEGEKGRQRETKGDRGGQRETKGGKRDGKGRHREPLVLCMGDLCFDVALVYFLSTSNVLLRHWVSPRRN